MNTYIHSGSTVFRVTGPPPAVGSLVVDQSVPFTTVSRVQAAVLTVMGIKDICWETHVYAKPIETPLWLARALKANPPSACRLCVIFGRDHIMHPGSLDNWPGEFHPGMAFMSQEETMKDMAAIYRVSSGAGTKVATYLTFNAGDAPAPEPQKHASSATTATPMAAVLEDVREMTAGRTVDEIATENDRLVLEAVAANLGIDERRWMKKSTATLVKAIVEQYEKLSVEAQ